MKEEVLDLIEGAVEFEVRMEAFDEVLLREKKPMFDELIRYALDNVTCGRSAASCRYFITMEIAADIEECWILWK